MKKAITLFILLISKFSFSQTVSKTDTITIINANLVNNFDKDDIESMVTYYYASRIRKDNKWREVLRDSSEWSNNMKYAINKHNKDWEFIKFKNKGLFFAKDGSVSVKVYVLIKYSFGTEGNVRIDGGVDDVELVKVNGKWVISRVK